MTYKLECILALMAGMLMVLAFSPVHIIWVGLISPAVLFYLLSRYSPKQSAFLGLCFGIGFFGFGVSWVFVSIYVFGGTPAWLAVLITAGFVLVLAAFFALLGFILQKYFYQNNFSKALLVYPSLWALLEALRSWIFTGFPWLILGHAVENTVFAGFAPIFGAYGCSFWLILASSLCYLSATPHLHDAQIFSLPLLTNKVGKKIVWKASNFSLLALLCLLLTSYFLNLINWTQVVEQPLTVSLVQGNIQQNLRWDPDQVNHILLTYQRLTQGHYRSDLIIWPEAAIPLTSDNAKPFLDNMNANLALTHSALLTGIPYVQHSHYYNAVMSLGDAYGVYFKRHLVPFGEYVPFEHWLRGLIQFFNLPMSNFLPGKFRQNLMTVHDVPMGVYVCYEVAYGNVVREDLPTAGLLVTVSDDAWFGRSFAPWQHLQIGQFQALATGRSMLFAGNTGITAIINHKGQIQAMIPQFVPDVLTGKVYEHFGATPWVILGDTPWIMMMLIFLTACFSRERVK